jgi:ethanolamine utilization cobalamin adenosyltransferase
MPNINVTTPAHECISKEQHVACAQFAGWRSQINSNITNPDMRAVLEAAQLIADNKYALAVRAKIREVTDRDLLTTACSFFDGSQISQWLLENTELPDLPKDLEQRFVMTTNTMNLVQEALTIFWDIQHDPNQILQ